MINYSKEEVFEKIIEAKKDNKAVVFKKFISEDFLPSWDELFDCIYSECQENSLHSINTELESLIGNVIFRQPLFMTTLLDQEKVKKYFPKIDEFESYLRIKYDLHITCVGPKISLGPFTVGSHIDKWHGFSLQCQGNTNWTFSDTELNTNKHTYKETIYAEKGDLLFFPQGVFHEIKVDSPRASMQFNSPV